MSLRKLCALALAGLVLAAPHAPALAAAFPAAPPAVGQDDTPGEAEQAAFTRGQNLYNQGRYEQAANVFRDFLKNYPNSIITDLTLLWLGRTYIAQGRLKEAEQVGQQLRGIKDTPFVEIYDGELQAATEEAKKRPPVNTNNVGGPRRSETASAQPTNENRASETAASSRPPVNTNSVGGPRRREIAGGSSGAPSLVAPQPTPTPTARMVGSATRPPRTNPTPRPTPYLVAESRSPSSRPGLNISNPTPSPTPDVAASTGSPSRAGSRRAGRRQPPARSAEGTRGSSESASASPTPVRPAPTPRATPVARATPPPTPAPTPRRREQVAASTPAPTPASSSAAINAGAAPNESVSSRPPVTSSAPGTQEGVVFTVKQVPNLALALRRTAIAASPGQSVQVPLVITNSGNKEDQFRLETDLPAEFQPTFSLAQGGQDTGLPILVTPQLMRGQNLDVLLNIRVPETAADGVQRRFIVRAASQADFQVNRVADAMVAVVAAALAGSSAVGKESVQPGETFTQTISVRNQGSAAARSARADFVFSPDFELVNANPLPLFYDSASRTAVWSLGDLDSRASRDITVTLRAMPDALAANRTVGRGIMRTASLPVPSNFDGPSINVGRVPRARVEAVSAGLTATPGDVMFIPFVVRNPGNYPESYELRIVTASGAPVGVLFADTNGDGQHQEAEPQIARTGQIEPRGGQYPMLLRVEIPRETRDREQYAYNVVAQAAQSNRAASEANTVLTVAAPRVRVRTEQVTDETAPGDVSFYRLVLVNDGGGLAKNLSVTEVLPDALQLVSTNPQLGSQDAPGNSQRIVWRVAELAPGDTSVLLVTVRLRSDLAAGGTVTTTRTWAYQDTNGNTYQNR